MKVLITDMKVLIAKWPMNKLDGNQYTLFITPTDKRSDCFAIIDVIGDPTNVKYKIFDMDLLLSGIEDQGHIRDIYSVNHIKEQNFKNYSPFNRIKQHTINVPGKGKGSMKSWDHSFDGEVERLDELGSCGWCEEQSRWQGIADLLNKEFGNSRTAQACRSKYASLSKKG